MAWCAHVGHVIPYVSGGIVPHGAVGQIRSVLLPHAPCYIDEAVEGVHASQSNARRSRHRSAVRPIVGCRVEDVDHSIAHDGRCCIGVVIAYGVDFSLDSDAFVVGLRLW